MAATPNRFALRVIEARCSGTDPENCICLWPSTLIEKWTSELINDSIDNWASDKYTKEDWNNLSDIEKAFLILQELRIAERKLDDTEVVLIIE